MTYRTGDSPKIDDLALAIATIYTKGGYYYLGPDTDVNLIKQAKEDIETGTDEYEVTQVYVSPIGEDNMPDSDADPLWMWSR